MATKPYIHKVPVEILREILRCTIGPSLSDPQQDTLHAYEVFLTDHGRLATRYVTNECIRRKLMLVCILWRNIVEGMDDKIVIGGMDEFDWPPNKRRSEAKYMHYVRFRDRSQSQGPIIWPSRWSRMHAAGVVPDGDTWGHESLELVIDTESPPAPVMLVSSMTIKLGNEVPMIFNGLVRAFNWIIPDENTDTEILRTSLFDNLTYLALSVGRDFPQALVQPQWTFPTLRALVVNYNSYDSDRVDSFGRWLCPNLTMLRYSIRRPYYSEFHPIQRGMLLFINTHTRKLQELMLIPGDEAHWGFEENWKRLIALKSYTFHSPERLVKALPFMQGLWTGVDGASATRRLRIGLLWFFAQDPPSVICAQVAPYKGLLPKLDLCLFLSWPDVLNAVRDEQKQDAIDFLAMIDELGLNVVDVDGQPLDSPAARKLREDILVLSTISEDELDSEELGSEEKLSDE